MSARRQLLIPNSTAAVIDRIGHHAVILERTGLSFQAEEAKARVGME